MKTVELLLQFNLTSIEATIYYTLLQKGSMNGYQIAKMSGISRSNTYTSLASLVEKGCAYVIEGDSTLYSPLSIDEFCSNRIRSLELAKQKLVENMPQKSLDTQGYITIKGKKHILDKMKNMIDETHQRIYFSLSRQTLEFLQNQITALAAKNIKIVLITDEPAKLAGVKTYPSTLPIKQVRIISDSSKVLTGDFDDSSSCTCLYSEKKNLVDLIKNSIKNEMTLIELRNK